DAIEASELFSCPILAVVRGVTAKVADLAVGDHVQDDSIGHVSLRRIAPARTFISRSTNVSGSCSTHWPAATRASAAFNEASISARSSSERIGSSSMVVTG